MLGTLSGQLKRELGALERVGVGHVDRGLKVHFFFPPKKTETENEIGATGPHDAAKRTSLTL